MDIRTINPNDYGLFFHGDHVLTERNNQAFILPISSFIPFIATSTISHSLTLGPFKQQHLHAIHLHPDFTNNHPDMQLIPARDLLATATNSELCNLLCRAKQLLTWHRSSLFCGHCGAETRLDLIEMCKRCDTCASLIYPSTSPAIIVLIQRDDHILLGRSPHFPRDMYSTLAGFVDAGECCEETIHREIKEEVNLEVQNIRYFGSQAWPFPNSFMLGFLADYASGEIQIDPKEIEDAQWFSKKNLPLIPPPYSISRQMIDFVCKIR